MRYGVLLFIIVVAVFGELPPDDGLFATVVNIDSDDTLNVRQDPSYRAKKIGALPLEAYVGVDVCQHKGRALWCKIHHIAQRDYDAYGPETPDGWVNAKYLRFIDSGYVLVDGKPNCDYVLGCESGMCELVADYSYDENHTIISLKTKKIARKRLRGSSNFGAMTPGVSGYCGVGNKIEDYLRAKSIRAFSTYSKDPAYQRAFLFLQRFDLFWVENMLPFIHPQRGLRVGYQTHFSGYDRVVFPKELKRMEKQREKRYFWGYENATGEKIYKSLYDVLWEMTPDLSTLKEVQPLPDLRGFPCKRGQVCKGYVFYSYEKPRDIDFGWQGLVVIVEQIEGKWYVVGVLRDRWEI